MKISIFCPICGAERKDWPNRAKRLCRSCGYKNRKTNRTHGHTVGGQSSKTFNSWRGMVERCKPDNPYGKLGISVCDRWRVFANFLADMGERPDGHEIDRIDSTGNYEPSNCQWKEARINRQRRRTIKLDDEKRRQILEMKEAGISHKSIALSLDVSKSCVTDFLSGTAWAV